MSITEYIPLVVVEPFTIKYVANMAINHYQSMNQPWLLTLHKEGSRYGVIKRACHGEKYSDF